jgi:hypothetical protein
MALTNFRNNQQQESGFDEMQKLMCSTPGCQSRWTVMIDRPKCSYHQWGTTAKPSSDMHKLLKTKPVPHWNDKEEIF